MKVIVNADDFGISLGTNYGIIEAHKNGIVSSTTMMMNQAATDSAMELLKKYRSLGVGIHFCLTKGKPLVEGLLSLVDDKGNFRKDYETIMNADKEEVKMELRAQFDKFLSYGEMPTHIDSHHHVHTAPVVMEVVEEIAKEYNLPVRTVKGYGLGTRELVEEVRTNDRFGNFYGDDLTAESLINILGENKDGEILEIMCHPAFLDEIIFYGSSYNTSRINEYRILTSSEIKNYIEKHKIELVSYKDI